jgi:uncharacterized protein (TIGR03083 family)
MGHGERSPPHRAASRTIGAGKGRGVIQQADYASSVERDSTALADAAAGHFDADVVSCPGWNVADLVWHLREVQWFWRTVVEGQLAEPPDEASAPARPDDPEELLADFREGAGELVKTIQSADPGAHCWTWAPQKDAAFVIRHQAQEAAVHRWDAERAVGHEHELDPEIAADGIDEFLMFSTGWIVDDTEPLPGPVRLETTDSGGAWTVTEDDGRSLRIVGLGHGAPGQGHSTDAVTTVRGSASDLLLGLYRRVGPERLSIEGDPAGWPALVARNDLD